MPGTRFGPSQVNHASLEFLSTRYISELQNHYCRVAPVKQQKHRVFAQLPLDEEILYTKAALPDGAPFRFSQNATVKLSAVDTKSFGLT
jgi:hypothetical protein